MSETTLKYIADIKERVNSPIRVESLTEDMMWQKQGPLIWQAEKFVGSPTFYPVYKWQNYYSYSPFALIVKKDHLHLNQEIYKKASKRNFRLLLSEEIIDKDIVRIGQSIKNDRSITEPEDYMKKVVHAVNADIAEIENINPGFVNFVMCGGKDSLNMLLFAWKNPVVALSAEPNYPLVCKFVEKNNLDIEVRRLDDLFDAEMLEQEILECCCRREISHWKWGADLRKIADEYDRKVIFWKGQCGNMLFTPDWKNFIWPPTKLRKFLGKIYKKTSHFMPNSLKYWIGEMIMQQNLIRNWQSSSVRLGAHMGFIRMLCSSLALSAYHGRRMTALYKGINLARAVQYDLREDIGELLLGRKVWYPTENPAPPLSTFRIGLHKSEWFLKILQENGIRVDGKIE